MIETVTFHTQLGDGEAYMEHKPSWRGSAIWSVNLPWRSFRFVGPRSQMARITESMIRNDHAQQESGE